MSGEYVGHLVEHTDLVFGVQNYRISSNRVVHNYNMKIKSCLRFEDYLYH